MSQTIEQTQKDKQTKGGRQAAQRPKTVLIITSAVIATAIIIGLVLIVTNSSSGASGGALRDTEIAFSVPTLVGHPAPEFTATDANGQPFAFKPGDGRAKVLIFYMGYR